MYAEETGVDVKGLFRRRKKTLVLIALPILLVAVATAFLLPPVYLSECTILIEDQQIPQDLVRSTITTYVEERLQMITQQIVSRSTLEEIITRFDLYADLRDRFTAGEIVQKMREAIRLDTISAEAADRNTGRPGSATIAFSVSYEGSNPGKVYQVANVLASLYVEQNLKSRGEQASNTTAFLQRELDEVEEHIDSVENQISSFKRAHLGELPEFAARNLQTMELLTREREQTEARILSLEERRVYLEGQLATVEPFLPGSDNLTQKDSVDRLKQLRLQLISLLAQVSEIHPDVKRLKKEIRDLEAEVGEADESTEKAARQAQLKARLTTLEGRLGPQHPDVVKLSKEVAALAEDSGSSSVVADLDTEEGRIENPAHMNLQTQVDSIGLEIEGLRELMRKNLEKVESYRRRVENAPLVEKEYVSLARDYENSKRQYGEIQRKLMEAKVSQGMEESQRAERFTIVDPAQKPEKPHKPNRLLIVLVGLVLSLGASVGTAAAQESLDRSVKTVEEINVLTDVPVLVALPLVETTEEKRARMVRRCAWVFAGGATMAVALVLVHWYVSPLDILWIKIQGRIGKALPL